MFSSKDESRRPIDQSVSVSSKILSATVVVKGQTYPLTVTGSYQNPCWIKAFIDYNNDGDFADADETLISEFAFSGTVRATVPGIQLQPMLMK